MIAVTREHQVRARAAGACRVPREGTRLDRLRAEQMAWADDAGLLTAEEARAVWEAAVSGMRMDLRATPPLALLARSGCGDGSCLGSGYGHGLGYGYGWGYGSGHGYGRAYGSDLGDGSGYGSDLDDDDGAGDGYGYGYGYGDDDGAGDGYGYGYGYGHGPREREGEKA